MCYFMCSYRLFLHFAFKESRLYSLAPLEEIFLEQVKDIIMIKM